MLNNIVATSKGVFMITCDTYSSPIGEIYIIADDFGVRNVLLTMESFEKCKDAYLKKNVELKNGGKIASQAISQLKEYFGGTRTEFTVPLSIEGRDFSKKVWEQLMLIPYGEIRYYCDVSLAVGSPKAHRAVGQANRSNPIPIFIPCHRVIGKNGKLTGYMGTSGLKIKEFLLELEKNNKAVK